MATQDYIKHYIRYYGSATPMVIDAVEAATQSYSEGDLVYLVNGKVTACATDGTSIAGLAMEDATGTTDTATTIQILPPGTFLVANTYKATEAGAAYAQALAGDGSQYELYVDASGRAMVDLGASSNSVFEIVALLDTVGDAYGKVVCRVIDAANQCAGA